MIMVMLMPMGTIITVTVTTTTATIMSGRKKSLQLRKKGERKRSQPSWPGSSRPSTPYADDLTKAMDARGQRGHDDEIVSIAALYRLMAWLSPSFPVGAFSYSSGIEWAVETGDIRDSATLKDWLSLMMSDGAGFCDAVLFAQAHRAVRKSDTARLREIAELGAAFSPSKERHLETTAQGRAFVMAVRAAWPCESLDMLDAMWDGPVAYPVAVGTACAGHGIAVGMALPAFLHAVAANWISAGVRLIPLGQTDGQRMLAALENIIAITAARALSASLDDIGGAALRADIGSMRHETQYTRLFRS
jgi:urease accessory protein